MTIEQFLDILGRYPQVIILFLGFLPLASFIYGRYIAGARIAESPHRFVMSTLVYLACVPGIFSATISVYTLLVLRGNLLQVNMLHYFFPVVMMILTLVTISRLVNLDLLPGFNRLRGLMGLLTLTFVVTFLVMQTRIWLIFGGSITAMILLLIALFLVFKWLSRMVFRNQ